MPSKTFLVVGAGASGLMAARELAKSGKRVLVLEARDRIGGRIWPFPEHHFDVPTQGGAEFVHGDAPLTKELARKANIDLLEMKGEMWACRYGKIFREDEPIKEPELLKKKMHALRHDVPISRFLEENFPGEKHSETRSSVIRIVEGYDAADTKRMSTFDFRDEWLGEGEHKQYRVIGGYGRLLAFLESECAEQGVVFHFNALVEKIHVRKDHVEVSCSTGKAYAAEKVLVTVPLPLIKGISFKPELPEKLEASSQMGYGAVIKIIIMFKKRWWLKADSKDLGKMDFMLSNEPVGIWWTQYPDDVPILTGWISGINASERSRKSAKEILDLTLSSLSNIFKLDRKVIEKMVVASRVINWVADPLVQGAYSYATPESEKARKELVKPVGERIFFAGEALAEGGDHGTVEAALQSGNETARKMLK